jgi:hypothetical protein
MSTAHGMRCSRRAAAMLWNNSGRAWCIHHSRCDKQQHVLRSSSFCLQGSVHMWLALLATHAAHGVASQHLACIVTILPVQQLRYWALAVQTSQHLQRRHQLLHRQSSASARLIEHVGESLAHPLHLLLHAHAATLTVCTDLCTIAHAPADICRAKYLESSTAAGCRTLKQSFKQQHVVVVDHVNCFWWWARTPPPAMCCPHVHLVAYKGGHTEEITGKNRLAAGWALLS